MTMALPQSSLPLNPFRQIHDVLGYRDVVCVIPPGADLKPDLPFFAGTSRSRGKCPGVRTADGWVPYNYKARPLDPDTDLNRFHEWGGSVGLWVRDDLCALDVDCLNKDLSNRIATAIFARTGRTPVRVGRNPKFLVLVRIAREDVSEGRLRYRVVHFSDGTDKRAGVEVFAGGGKQVVAYGPHAIDGEASGTDYVWVGGMPAYDDLPVLRWSVVEGLLTELAGLLPDADRPGRANLTLVRTEVDQRSLRAAEEHVARLVASIPNRQRYDALVEMAAAIRGACQDAYDGGLTVFLEWCARWEDGEADVAYCEHVFESLEPPFGLGVQRLEYLAGHGAPGAEGTGRVEADPTRYLGAVDEADVDAAVALFPALPAGGVSMADERPKRRFERVRFDDAEERRKNSRRRPLIKGFIDRGAMSILYGDSNVGKTFVGVRIGHHVAQGKEFCGMKVAQGRVVYMTLEGGAGIDDRCIALLREAGPAPLFELIISPINLLDPDVDLAQLIDALQPNEDGDVALSVLDTLSRALAGGDENSSTDMGALVVNLDRIRQATGAHLMVVHHTGKDAARGARGHSLLRAATDTEIEVGEGSIKVTKQRDLPKDWQGAFTLKPVSLFKDEDGDDVTSAVAVVSSVVVGAGASDAAGHAQPPAPKELAVLKALAAQQGEDRSGAPTVKDVASFAPDDLDPDTARTMLNRLYRKGLVVKPSGRNWRVSSAGWAALTGPNVFTPLDENGEPLGLFD